MPTRRWGFSASAIVPWTVIFSSEGALIAITPYDYPQGKPLFEHTPVLDNNLNMIAMMTLVTIITSFSFFLDLSQSLTVDRC